MKRRVQWVLFTLRQLGLLGWVGVALLCGSLGYGLVVLPQHYAEVEALHHEIAELQQERLLLHGEQATGHGEAKPPLQLPTIAMTPEILATLEDIARQDGLQIKRNDYRYVDPTPVNTAKGVPSAEERESRLLEVRIVTPATGSYRNVRTFLSHALEKLPTLALDDMSLKREAIAGGDIQAQLRFTLFVRDGT